MIIQILIGPSASMKYLGSGTTKYLTITLQSVKSPNRRMKCYKQVAAFVGALALVMPIQCVDAVFRRSTLNKHPSDQKNKHDSQIVEVTFNEFSGDDFGLYYNNDIQIENLYWVYYPEGAKSPPNIGGNLDRNIIISCPGGSFDIISMCLWSPIEDLNVLFNATLSHDDRCGLSVDNHQGTILLHKPLLLKCHKMLHSYKDLSSLTISPYVNLEDGTKALRQVGLENIKIRINKKCNVNNEPNESNAMRFFLDKLTRFDIP